MSRNVVLNLSIFCAAMSATIVANIQVEIGSYFDAGSLVSRPKRSRESSY